MAFLDSTKPQVFAHRGGCALGPENTIAAFDLGMAAGADGLELDVHLSADGVAVVCHDDTLDRTTDARGPVRLRTADELAKIDAGCRYVDSAGAYPFRARGAGVPRLREVLERYPNIPIIIEMKVDSADMGRAVVEEAVAAGAVDRVCAAGYGQRSIDEVRALAPSMATSACHAEVKAAVYRSMAGWPVRRAPYDVYQVPERSGLIPVATRRFVRHADQAGIRVQVWTVDTRADMERLLGWGVEGLISNRPDLAVRVRDEFLARQGVR